MDVQVVGEVTFALHYREPNTLWVVDLLDRTIVTRCLPQRYERKDENDYDC